MSNTKTTIDWLRFRTRAAVPDTLWAVQRLYGAIGERVSLDHVGKGRDGFQSGASILLDGLLIGRVDFGGSSQRGWLRVNIFGTGCEWVPDWDALDEIERLTEAEIRRLDIALTTWSREVTHESVVAAHSAGRFVCGGRPPKMRCHTSTDPRQSRTCYVGKRGSDKMFRGYEKGLQMAARWPALDLIEIDGHPVEDIYRCEVELQAETRPINWQCVHQRDHYFAGAYPFLADILPDVAPDVLLRRPERAARLDLCDALAQCRIQFGAAIFTALKAFDGDIDAVMERVCGDHEHGGLVAAGVHLAKRSSG